jgi:hypothetical protein
MFRTIAAAAIVFAFAAFALQHMSGPFEEPIILLVMGSLFLAVGKLFGSEKRAAPALVEQKA